MCMLRRAGALPEPQESVRVSQVSGGGRLGTRLWSVDGGPPVLDWPRQLLSLQNLALRSALHDISVYVSALWHVQAAHALGLQPCPQGFTAQSHSQQQGKASCNLPVTAAYHATCAHCTPLEHTARTSR